MSDYGFTQGLAYVNFAWSKADGAYETMFQLAAEHRLGFFNVSSDASEVWVPANDGTLQCTHRDTEAFQCPTRRSIGRGKRGAAQLYRWAATSAP